MACQSNDNNVTHGSGTNYIIIIVLYILLAIILGSALRNNFY